MAALMKAKSAPPWRRCCCATPHDWLGTHRRVAAELARRRATTPSHKARDRQRPHWDGSRPVTGDGLPSPKAFAPAQDRPAASTPFSSSSALGPAAGLVLGPGQGGERILAGRLLLLCRRIEDPAQPRAVARPHVRRQRAAAPPASAKWGVHILYIDFWFTEFAYFAYYIAYFAY